MYLWTVVHSGKCGRVEIIHEILNSSADDFPVLSSIVAICSSEDLFSMRVIPGSLLLVRKNLVSGLYLDELVRCSFCIFVIFVWMVLEC
jgi:hypothetical protein